ncbi:hypothetical protein R6Q57_024577 [Mikania cordata]
MDVTFLQDYNLHFQTFLILTIFVLLVLKQTKLFFFKKRENVPPSPPQLPIIGNLHQVDGDRPHVSLANLAKIYGPLMSLHFGQQLVVVASSPEAAMQILKTKDHLLSSRVVPTSVKQEHLLPHSITFAKGSNFFFQCVNCPNSNICKLLRIVDDPIVLCSSDFFFQKRR